MKKELFTPENRTCAELPMVEVSVKQKGGNRIYKITNSKSCEELFRLMLPNEDIIWREHMMMLCLNRANNVCGYYRISSGGVSGTVVDPKIVFQIALGCNASAIILCHNPPSGNLKPSSDDISITKQIKEAGKILTINLLDHIILTADSFYSFADEGLI